MRDGQSLRRPVGGRSFAQRLGSLLVLEAVAGVLRVLSTLAFAVVLGPREFGTYALFVGTVLVLGQIAGLGAPAAGGYLAATGSARAAITRGGLLLAGSLVLAVIPLGLVVSRYLSVADIRYSTAAVLLTLGSCAMFAFETLGMHVLRGSRRLRVAGVVAVVRQVLLLLLSGSAGVFGWDGMQCAFGFGGVTVATALIACASALGGRACTTIPAETRLGFGFLAKYGLVQQVNNIAVTLLSRLDLLMVGALLSASAAGRYALVLTAMDALMFFAMVGSSALVGETAAATPDRRRQVTERMTRLVVAGTGLAGAGMILLAAGFAAVTAEGARIFPTLAISVVGIVAMGAAWVLSTSRAAAGVPQSNVRGSVSAVAINLGLNLILIPQWGIVGAALSTTVAYAYLAAERFRRHRSDFPDATYRAAFVWRRSDLAAFSVSER